MSPDRCRLRRLEEVSVCGWAPDAPIGFTDITDRSYWRPYNFTTWNSDGYWVGDPNQYSGSPDDRRISLDVEGLLGNSYFTLSKLIIHSSCNINNLVLSSSTGLYALPNYVSGTEIDMASLVKDGYVSGRISAFQGYAYGVGEPIVICKLYYKP